MIRQTIFLYIFVSSCRVHGRAADCCFLVRMLLCCPMFTETEAVVGQVLASLGLELGDQLVDAPANAKKHEEKEDVEDADKELEARLNNLKR